MSKIELVKQILFKEATYNDSLSNNHEIYQ